MDGQNLSSGRACLELFTPLVPVGYTSICLFHFLVFTTNKEQRKQKQQSKDKERQQGHCFSQETYSIDTSFFISFSCSFVESEEVRHQHRDTSHVANLKVTTMKFLNLILC